MADYEMLSLIKAIAIKHNLISDDDNVVDATAEALVDATVLTEDDIQVKKDSPVQTVAPQE